MSQTKKFADLETPEDDGQTLFVPPFSEYAGMIERNRALPREVLIHGAPLAGLAAQARKEIVRAAFDYTRALGLGPGAGYAPGPARGPGAPILAAGHQPFAFHPGVVVKSAAISEQAGRLNGAAIFFSVDSDEFRTETVPLPTVDSGLTRFDYYLFPQTGKTLYETAEADPPGLLAQRFRTMQKILAHERLRAPAETFNRFMRKIESVNLDDAGYTARVAALRRAWGAGVIDRFAELPVSRFCSQAPFLTFARDIVEKIEIFAPIYNAELARYRKAKKLRYPANPFPDLAVEQGRIETPFWILDGAARERLFVVRDAAGRTMLAGETGGFRPFSDIESGALRIRPRAITLSIFLRLFVCDLFVHGVGGSKYDTITDPIIRRFYRLEPPEYACVSATLWPGIEADDPRPRIEEVHRALRGMEHHPEKTKGAEDLVAAMAGEKEELVAMIRQPGADKKILGPRIAELNREMSVALAPFRKKLEKLLAALESKEKERRAAQARDYPYFLYEPERIAALLDH